MAIGRTNAQDGGGGSTIVLDDNVTESSPNAVRSSGIYTALQSKADNTDVPAPYASTPAMDGGASAGVSDDYARGDHVHPTDTTRAPLASPALTGNPTAPTQTAGNNSTRIATTAFVQTAISGKADAGDIPSAYTSTPSMDGTGSAGTGTAYARGNHVHPTDTTRAPISSPNFTGTPTAPTAAAGTDTTQVATTAFVKTAVDAVKVVVVNAILTAAGWNNGSQTVTVSGVTSSNTISVGLRDTATTVQRTAARNAQLFCTGQGTNSITVVADGTVPVSDIPISVEIWS